MLQKAGGVFQLLAELDFGTAYGVKSLYLKSRTASTADAGFVRLAKTDVVSWRNNAGGGNLDLGINGSDLLTFDGTALQVAITVSDTSTIDLTFGSNVLSADIKTNSITDSMINGSAAIAYSKLALTNTILNADINASAGIEYSKLELTNFITDSDIFSAAGIAYTKLNLSNSIINADIKTNAAIEFSKLEPLAATRILVGSAGNVAVGVPVTGDISIASGGAVTIGANTVTNSKLYLMAESTIKGRAASSGTGDPIDLTATQATAILNVMTGDAGSGGLKGLVPAQSTGDAVKFLNGAGTWSTPAGAGDVVGPGSATDGGFAKFNGTTGKLIKNSAATIAIADGGTGQVTKAAGFDALSPLDGGGQIIYGGASGTGTKLANGSAGQSLTSQGSTNAPAWVYADTSSQLIRNLGLTGTVGSSNLTIALKQADASTDPSATSPVLVGMRSSTAATGLYNIRSITSAMSLVINSGTKLGFANSVAQYLYVYLMDSDGAGTMKLAASTVAYDSGSIQTTMPESGTITVTLASPAVVTWTGHNLVAGNRVTFTTSGALPSHITSGTAYYVVSPATNTFQISATPGGTAINTTGDTQSGTHTGRINDGKLVSDAVYTNMPVHLIGRMQLTESTAGTWATGPAQISLVPFDLTYPSMLYKGVVTGTLNGSTNLATYPTKVNDNMNAYSGGVYVVQQAGQHSITAQVAINATFSADQNSIISVYINGAQFAEFYSTAGTSFTSIMLNLPLNSVSLSAWDLVDIRISSAGSSLSYGTAVRSIFSIVRTGP